MERRKLFEVTLISGVLIFLIFAVNLPGFNSPLSISGLYVVGLTLLPLILLRRHERSLRDKLGLGYGAKTASAYLALAGATIMFGLFSFPISSAFVVFLALGLAPLSEEVFFRGYLVNELRAAGGAAVAVIFSAVAFGVAHLAVTGTVEVFVLRAMLGLLLAIIFQRSGKLVVTVGLHMLSNEVVIFRLAAISMTAYLSLVSSISLAALCLLDYYGFGVLMRKGAGHKMF
jgi:membrane protease YdiL (CAAX protease family)